MVFHKSRHSIYGQTVNGTIHFYHDLDSLLKERLVEDYIVGSYSKVVKEDTLKHVYDFNGKIILIIDSLGVYEVKTFRPDVVVLRNSPKINIERLIDSINPSQIVADGSNYKSYIERWKATCRKRKIPFHNANEKGAYILK